MSEPTQPVEPYNPYLPPGTPDPAPGAPPLLAPAADIVTPRAVEMLQQTRPWVLFLSVVGFVASAIMIIGGACVGLMGLATRGSWEALLLLLYPLFGLIYLVPSYYLYGYATNLRGYFETRQPHQLESALQAQKSFWRFVGILTAVILVVYAILIVVVVAFAVWQAGR